MDDESKITHDTEVKDVTEGTIESEIVKEQSPTIDDKPVTETVPLAVYLDLKEDLKTLRKEMKEAKGTSKEQAVMDGLEELSQKYPDADKAFIADMLRAATEQATKKIEEKYTPIIEKNELEKKQIAFDRAFDNLFDRTLKENPELPQGIDKDTIKDLAQLPQYRNVPLVTILKKMYPVVENESGKSSSENDMRSGADRIEEVVSFDKMTEDQRQAVMDDPKARAKYFDWLDKQPGR